MIIAAESTVSGFGTSVQFGIWSCSSHGRGSTVENAREHLIIDDSFAGGVWSEKRDALHRK